MPSPSMVNPAFLELALLMRRVVPIWPEQVKKCIAHHKIPTHYSRRSLKCRLPAMRDARNLTVPPES